MSEAAMTIRGVRYVERPPGVPNATSGYCVNCAFFRDTEACRAATIEDVAVEAFGGDCIQRDVVYAKDDTPPQEHRNG